jgi:hypothetical protein
MINIIQNVTEAIPYLPNFGTTSSSGLGAAYAFLARVYLTMCDYTNAAKYADLALGLIISCMTGQHFTLQTRLK